MNAYVSTSDEIFRRFLRYYSETLCFLISVYIGLWAAESGIKEPV